MSSISIRSIDRLLKEVGCKRVSDDAIEEVRDIAERLIKEIGKTAWNFAKHANRRTLMRKDVDLAIKLLKY